MQIDASTSRTLKRKKDHCFEIACLRQNRSTVSKDFIHYSVRNFYAKPEKSWLAIASFIKHKQSKHHWDSDVIPLELWVSHSWYRSLKLIFLSHAWPPRKEDPRCLEVFDNDCLSVASWVDVVKTVLSALKFVINSTAELRFRCFGNADFNGSAMLHVAKPVK